MPKFLTAALVAALILLAAGCSRIELAYNSADFLIERYADDYLSLEGPQLASWSPRLDAALARHRSQELPYLAAFFDTAAEDARSGFNRANMNCRMDQFEVIFRRHFTLAADTASPLLAQLDKRQIDELSRTFEEEAREDAVDTGPEAVAKRKRKRAERYEKNLNWFVGDLSSKQRGIVMDVTRAMPDTAKAWYDYRDRKRRELIRLLRAGASEERIRTFMTDWLVEYRDLPPELRQARGAMRNQLQTLLIRLDPTFSAEQRTKLVERLTTLRDNFMSLQERPRMADKGC